MDFFAANIKHLRLQRGLKQHDFKELGFSRTQWNNYEKLVSRPKVGDVVKIANFFGVTETELMHTDIQERSKNYPDSPSSSQIVSESGSPYSSLKADLIESLQLNVNTLKQLLEVKDIQIEKLKSELESQEPKTENDH